MSKCEKICYFSNPLGDCKKPDYVPCPLEVPMPVVKGKWIERFDGRYSQRRTYCSVCGKHSRIGGTKQEPPYCPNCGAKMECN